MKEAIIKYNEDPKESHLVIEWQELIRCKDCKHHGNINKDYCRCLEQETNNDFFCWYGERKDT